MHNELISTVIIKPFFPMQQIELDSSCYDYNNRHKRESVYQSERGHRGSFGNPAVNHAAQDSVHRISNLLALTGGGKSNDYDHLDSASSLDYSTAYDDGNSYEEATAAGTHGKIHQSPDTRESTHNSDYFKDLDSARPSLGGGGGGGGATIIFKVRKKITASKKCTKSQCQETKMPQYQEMLFVTAQNFNN